MTGTVVSCGGTGDVALAVANAGHPVVAVFPATADLALCALKAGSRRMAAIEQGQVLGLGPPGRRVFLYHRLRDALPAAARAYWDEREVLVREGVLGCGEFEQGLATARASTLDRAHRRATRERLLSRESLAEQRAFYERRFDTVPWRVACRVFARRSGATPGALDRLLREAFLPDCPGLWWTMTGTFASVPQWLVGPPDPIQIRSGSLGPDLLRGAGALVTNAEADVEVARAAGFGGPVVWWRRQGPSASRSPFPTLVTAG